MSRDLRSRAVWRWPRMLRLPTLGLIAIAALAIAGSTVDAQDEADPDPFDPEVLRSWRLDFEDADWPARLEAGQTVLADLEVEGETYADVALSEKGNSSARVPGLKQPMNLTLDEVVEDQRLMGYDVVNLNNGFVNPTFTREVLTLRALGQHMPMPKAGWSRIDVGDDFFGLYVLVEQIEGTFLEQWFESNDGWLFKADMPDDEGGGGGPGPRPRPLVGGDAPASARSGGGAMPAAPEQGPGGGFRSALQWLGEDLAGYQSSYTLKSDAEDDAPWEALRELIRVLDAPEAEGGPSPADFAMAIRQVLDVDAALWYLAGQNLFTNYDSYYAGHNYYLYQAEEDQRWHVLAWDQNEAFGVFPGAGISPDDSTAVAQTDPFLMAEGARAAERPLIGRLLAVPEFRADYLAHYRTLLATVFEPAGLAARIETYQDMIRDAAQADPNRLYPFDLFEQNVREDVRANGRAVPGILKVAEARASWLAAREDFAAPDLALSEHRLEPAEPVAGRTTRVDLLLEGQDFPRGVELVYRVDGAAPERLTMAIGREGSWAASLPALSRNDDVTYYARAVTDDGRSVFFPASNLIHPWRFEVAGQSLPVELGEPLVINELLADNDTGLSDPEGELDDWLELYNRGDEPVDLAGYFLSDDEEDPFVYALPDIELAPGERFLVWCDNDPDQGPDHADFRMSKDGETLILSTDSVTVDRVEFGPQETDVSWARQPDGGEVWGFCEPPSPRAPNRCDGQVPPSATPTGEPDEPTATPDGVEPVGWLYLPRLER